MPQRLEERREARARRAGCRSSLRGSGWPPSRGRTDLLLLNARIVDGTGAPARSGDLGHQRRTDCPARPVVNGTGSRAAGRRRTGRRARVHRRAHACGRHRVASARRELRADGRDVDRRRQLRHRRRCAIGDALDRIRETTVAVNFATLIGHNTVRSAVMGSAEREPTIAEIDEMQVARVQGDGRRRRRLLDGSSVHARHLRQDQRDHRARARRGQRRRHLCHAHAQRGHGARGGGGRVDSRRSHPRHAARDLASESRQSEPLGREQRRAEAHRRRAGGAA